MALSRRGDCKHPGSQLFSDLMLVSSKQRYWRWYGFVLAWDTGSLTDPAYAAIGELTSFTNGCVYLGHFIMSHLSCLPIGNVAARSRASPLMQSSDVKPGSDCCSSRLPLIYLCSQPVARQGQASVVSFVLTKAMAFLPKISCIRTASNCILWWPRIEVRWINALGGWANGHSRNKGCNVKNAESVCPPTWEFSSWEE